MMLNEKFYLFNSEEALTCEKIFINIEYNKIALHFASPFSWKSTNEVVLCTDSQQYWPLCDAPH